MAQNWFYKVKDEELGPVSSGELKEKAEAGEVMLTTPVRREGDADWAEARLVKGLFPPAIAEAAAKAALAREAAEKEAAERLAAREAAEQEANEKIAARKAAKEAEREARKSSIKKREESAAVAPPMEDAAAEEATAEETPVDPADLDPITLTPLEPVGEAPAAKPAEEESASDEKGAKKEKRAKKPAGERIKLSPKLLAAVGGGVALVVVLGLAAFFFLGGEQESPEPGQVQTPQASAAQKEIQNVTRLANSEQYAQAQEVLTKLQDMDLTAGEQAQVESLMPEVQDGLDEAAAAELLTQVEQQLAQKDIEAALETIAAYEANPRAAEEEKARLATLGEELARASDADSVAAAVAAMSEEELAAFNSREWEPEEPFENALASEIATGLLTEAVTAERARRKQAAEEAAAAAVAATRMTHDHYIGFRRIYDEYMLRIVDLRLDEVRGEPSADWWAYIEGFPKMVQDNLDASQSFAGRKHVLEVAAQCRDYLEYRTQQIEEKVAAVGMLKLEVAESAANFPADSLGRSVYAELRDSLATQEALLESEAEKLAAALTEIQFEYALEDRRESLPFVEQLAGGMLELKKELADARAAQKAIVFDTWAKANSDYPEEWETEYQAIFLAEQTAAIEAYLKSQETRLERSEGLLGHWRRKTAEGEESFGLDLYIEWVDLAEYDPPPVGGTWDTAANLLPGAAYLILSDDDNLNRPTVPEVAALDRLAEPPTGIPPGYLIGEGVEDARHLVRAVHVIANRTVPPQGRLEGWCVLDDRGRMYLLTGARYSWTSPPAVTGLVASRSGEGLSAGTLTQPAGLELAGGLLAFGEQAGWSGEPGVAVLAGEYEFVGEARPSWGDPPGAPVDRPAEEHPFLNPAWRNDTEPLEGEAAEGEEPAEDAAAAEEDA